MKISLVGISISTFALADLRVASSSAALDLSAAVLDPFSAFLASAAVASAFASTLSKAFACAFFDICDAAFSSSGE